MHPGKPCVILLFVSEGRIGTVAIGKVSSLLNCGPPSGGLRVRLLPVPLEVLMKYKLYNEGDVILLGVVTVFGLLKKFYRFIFERNVENDSQ